VKNKKHELCKGCTNTDTHMLYASLTCQNIPVIDHNCTCPCSECLIKTTCSVTCEPFLKFYNLSRKIRGEPELSSQTRRFRVYEKI
jgi:hypothetical protein